MQDAALQRSLAHALNCIANLKFDCPLKESLCLP
uniref:Uncharacterized protein n=1 Tax=Anguilla anguilla TaxID=7936 RepID=A0A0E9TNS6_ANGAN